MSLILSPSLHPWMATPEVKRVLEAFTKEEEEVRFVGGCVRDAILGRPVQDVDLATPATPPRVINILEAAGIAPVPTGLTHGTITAVVNGMTFEITSLREDVNTDGRHAVVAFTKDWHADAARRDFTMNALSCTPEGHVFDFFNGTTDAKAGRVRFIGQAEQRIREDFLRLLRFFRFYAHYGKGPPDPEALTACNRLAFLLVHLSKERIRAELLKLLAAPDPAPVWEMMIKEKVIEYVLPLAQNVPRLQALTVLEQSLDQIFPLRRLAALLSPGTAQTVSEDLCLSGHEQHVLSTLTVSNLELLDLDDKSLRRCLRQLGPDQFKDLLLLEAAGKKVKPETLRPILEKIRAWVISAFPLHGQDVLDLGIQPGPQVGALLKQVETWWENADYTPDRKACLLELAQRVKNNSS